MEHLLNKFAHELRNPLTTLYSTVQLIEFQHPEVKNFKYWSNLNSDIEYMEQLVAQFSDFTKSEKFGMVLCYDTEAFFSNSDSVLDILIGKSSIDEVVVMAGEEDTSLDALCNPLLMEHH